MQQSILWPRYNVNTPLVPSWSNSPCLKMCYCSWSIDTNSEGKSWDKTEFTATEIWRISVLVKCDQQQGFICDSCFWMSFQSVLFLFSSKWSMLPNYLIHRRVCPFLSSTCPLFWKKLQFPAGSCRRSGRLFWEPDQIYCHYFLCSLFRLFYNLCCLQRHPLWTQ